MSVAFKDGKFVEKSKSTVSFDDSGFANGLGIFDSMLVKNGELIHAADHYQRITYDTAIVLRLKFYMEEAQWRDACMNLLNQNGLSNGCARVRTTVTGGISDRPIQTSDKPSIIITVAPCPEPETIAPATCAIITDYPRIAGSLLENCKRLDYSRAFAARQDAKALGADEAIITNTDGNIACGATSNIFIREGAHLITPPLSDGVLAGVTRKNIIDGCGVIEDSISIERLIKADEIFLTNCFVGHRKITLINPPMRQKALG
jgi:branched-chain amino acid aminotransferase